MDGDGVTDVLLVGAPMFFSEARERGRVSVYGMREVSLSNQSIESVILNDCVVL